MLLANGFTHDTRVYKEARSLITWGCEVHVVALAVRGLEDYEEKDGIHVHRVKMETWRVLVFPLAIVCWWCRPLLRRVLTALGQGKPAKPEGKRKCQEAKRPRKGFVRGPASAIASLGQRPWATFLFLFGSPLVNYMIRTAMRLGSLVRRLISGVRRRVVSLVRRLINAARRRMRGVLRRMMPGSFRLIAFNIGVSAKAHELGPDVIQSHDLNTLFAGAIVKRLKRVPLVYDSHELFLERNLGDRSRAWSNAVWAPIERAYIGKCDAVFSVAEGICRHLADQYNISKPHLIRNVQPYEDAPTKTTILADELGIADEKALAIYAGAITFNRGLEMMIDSAPYLKDAVYVIMGYARNPKYLEALRKRAEDLDVLDRAVFFRDAVPIEDVVRYTASADIGVVPTQNVCLSYFFESSNKIFHCLMAGVPLAMSDHAEKRIIANTHGVGVLFDETDPVNIAAAINGMLADGQEYQRMRRNCLVAAKELNWQCEEHKLRTVFAELLAARVEAVADVCLPENDASMIETMAATSCRPVS